MTHGVIVRPAGPADLDGLLTLYTHLNPNDPLPARDRAQVAWKRMLDTEFLTVFVAVLPDGFMAATCTLIVVPNLMRAARPYSIIENVVTHADHRRQGYGSAVMKAAIIAAHRADCYKCSLATGSQREETLRFYENVGMVRNAKSYFEVRWI